LDVETPASDEVRDALPGLRRACRVRAPVRHFAFDMLDRAVAHRAARRHLELRIACSLLTRVDLDPHDLWDDVTCALDDHAVALPYVEPMDLVQVVKGRALHR